MVSDIRTQAIKLHDRFTHEGLPRREFMAEMTRLAGGVAAASALVGSIAACSKSQPLVAGADRRLKAGTIDLLGTGGQPIYQAYAAEPNAGARATVLVIHENRGLNEHIRDVARRLALAGFYAVAPDLLSPSGGTPADEDQARDAIAKLDLAAATAAGVAMLNSLARREGGNGKVGAVGFCWGGAYVNRLAVAAGRSLAAGVAYYGPAPDPVEAAKVDAPLLLHYAGLDARVNSSGAPWVAALKAAGKTVESYTYPNVNHAFNNDTSAERYDKAAADLAWKRTLRAFREHLA